MTCSIDAACVFAGSPPLLMARVQIVGDDFSLDDITQSDVASITYSVTDTSDGTATASGSLAAAAVIYDTLQTGDVWTTDSTGFNFAHRPSAASIPDGNKTYIAEYVITSGDGQVVVLRFTIQTKKVYG